MEHPLDLTSGKRLWRWGMENGYKRQALVKRAKWATMQDRHHSWRRFTYQFYDLGVSCSSKMIHVLVILRSVSKEYSWFFLASAGVNINWFSTSELVHRCTEAGRLYFPHLVLLVTAHQKVLVKVLAWTRSAIGRNKPFPQYSAKPNKSEMLSLLRLLKLACEDDFLFLLYVHRCLRKVTCALR